MKDQETKEKFIELRAKGISFEKIAKELKVSKQTLISWSKEFKLQIANLREIELEALREKYYLTKRQQLELFGQQLQAIKTELEKRNLSDVPTDKLFDLLGKYGKLMKDEAAETVVFKAEKGMMDMDFTKTTESWQT